MTASIARAGGLHDIFKTLANTTAVLDWLSYVDDSVEGGASIGSPLHPVKDPVMPDFTQYGTVSDEKGTPPPLAQKLPAGWSYRAIGPWTVAMSALGAFYWAVLCAASG
ncbi:hypothetical protein LJC36_02765 [Desulfovibrio sp. OttesenSCG-928-C14]|nr:hypothetical protein [Desulfovibrio sp. OttesenSCG-928-C14]